MSKLKTHPLKYFLSFFHDQQIETISSPNNSYLEVSLAKGRYKLSTKNAIYSYEDLYTNFVLAFQQLKIAQRKIQSVLLLGFGMGSIPIILKKYHGLIPCYTAIELDPEVIRLAKKYLPAEILKSTDLKCTDAYEFVTQATEKYDMINVDIFIDDKVPRQFEKEAFLQKLDALLINDGVLLFNRLSRDTASKKATEDFFSQSFKKVFPDSKSLPVRGNQMLVYEKA